MLGNGICIHPVIICVSIVIWFLLNQIVISTGNIFFCQKNQQCTFLEYCPDIVILMKRNELPIHRLRQSICDYSGLRPKVCCDILSYPVSPVLNEENIRSLLESRSYYNCGKSIIKNNIDNFGSYPFLARIGFINLSTGYVKYPCSGTIINERAVVTTASCALANTQIYKLYIVTIGEFNTETDPDCNSLFCGHKVKHYNISYVTKHPNYCPDNFENNIAIIRLERPIRFEAMAQSICLLPKDIYIGTGSNTVLIGWGRLSNQKDILTTQQELKMILLPKQNCLDFLNEGYSVEMCALGQAEPCSAYNGSPLLYKYDDIYFLVGILSYGSNCDDKSNLPVVFVDVQKYSRWLLKSL